MNFTPIPGTAFGIRQARTSDLAAISEAASAAFDSPELGPEVAEAVRQSLEAYGDTPLREQTGFVQLRYHVAIHLDSGQLAGMAGLYHPTWIGPHVLYLAWFFIAPDFQKKGLGSGLLDATLKMAVRLGGERLMVETSDGLDPAQALYARSGFTECGRVPDYWGQSALVLLTRRLDDVTPEPEFPEHFPI